MPGQRTPLYDAHKALGARMIDFGGWDMPVSYPAGTIKEHKAVRESAGLFDVSHMGEAWLRGPRATEAVQLLTTNDVGGAAAGKAVYTLLCRPDGGIVDDCIFYKRSATEYFVILNASNTAKDLAWMREQIGAMVDIEDASADTALIAVQGPRAVALVDNLAGGRGDLSQMGSFTFADTTIAGVACMAARTGYTGEDGFEAMVLAKSAPFFWKALMEAGGKPIGLGARDTLRLEAGMNLYGQDMDETASPLESGLAWTVDLKTERDFVGRAALEKSEVTKQLAGLLLLDKGVLRSHQKVLTKNGDGEITSGTFSPTLQQSIALARIPLGIAPGEEVEVEIRDKKLKARVVKYPFVRNGKVLI